MNAFVTDTHALLWHAMGAERKLGRKVKAAFAAVEREETILYVPLPVVMETTRLRRAGAFRDAHDAVKWWQRLKARPNVIIVSMEFEDVAMALELEWDHPDLMDRLIAVTALRLGLPLATADRAISEWGGVPILW